MIGNKKNGYKKGMITGIISTVLSGLSCPRRFVAGVLTHSASPAKASSLSRRPATERGGQGTPDSTGAALTNHR
jgi:hypothetical protein